MLEELRQSSSRLELQDPCLALKQARSGVLLRVHISFCTILDALRPHLSCPGQPTRTAPPLTLKISPVINPACGVHKNKIGPAISSGVPTRPMGIGRRTSFAIVGSSSEGRDISVSTHPGATEFT